MGTWCLSKNLTEERNVFTEGRALQVEGTARAKAQRGEQRWRLVEWGEEQGGEWGGVECRTGRGRDGVGGRGEGKAGEI